jgi:DNA-binding transcriptional LysR family regulator
VEDSLRTLDLGIEKTRAMTGQTGAVIDLAFIYTLGSEFVPELVADFIRSHEELDVRFKFI